MKKLELFPTPVAIFDLEDHEQLNDELMSIPELLNKSFMGSGETLMSGIMWIVMIL